MKPNVEYFVWPRPSTANAKEIADILNVNAERGWRLVAVDNDMYVLEREIEREHGPTPCALHRDRPSVTWVRDNGALGMRTACAECKAEYDEKSNVLNAVHLE